MSTDFDHVADPSDGRPATRSAGGAEGQRPDGASEASALGSTQSYCFTPAGSSENDRPPLVVDSGERRRVRWAARAMLWQASSLKAVRCCGRVVRDRASEPAARGVVSPTGVVIRRRIVDGRMVASYGGLMTCGSVWACPRCSAVVAHTRAAEISSAVRECYRLGGRVYMLTLTMRHTSRDELAMLWDSLSVAWRAAFGSRAWTGQRERTELRGGRPIVVGAKLGDAERFDVAGLTRVAEATYGRPQAGGNGWHLHIHALLFIESSLASGIVSDAETVLAGLLGSRCDVDREWVARNVFAGRVHARWTMGLAKSGCGMPGSVGVDVREIADRGAEYVGRYLSKSTYEVSTRVGLEIAAGAVTKETRVERNWTPFEVLAELANSVDAQGFGVRTPRHWSVMAAGDGDWAVVDTDTGEVVNVTPPGMWRIWHEWECASKGRRQITWSRRRREPVTRRELLWNALLDARGATADDTDEEVSAADLGGESLGEISYGDWNRVMAWRAELIVQMLEAAELRGTRGVAELCTLHGIDFVAHGPPDRRSFGRRPDLHRLCC
jgi:hypothetical protein